MSAWLLTVSVVCVLAGALLLAIATRARRRRESLWRRQHEQFGRRRENATRRAILQRILDDDRMRPPAKRENGEAS